MNEKSRNNFLIFACAFIWIAMMASKNVYTAELVEICGVFNVSKVDASLAMTYYFVVYSFAQIMLFFFLENLNIKWLLSISVFVSGFVTVIIAFATSMTQLWWIIALNGLLQAGVWGICIAVLKRYLPLNKMPFANTVMNVGMAVAAVISYSSSALSIGLGSWNMPFIVLGIILSISGVVFFIAVRACEKNHSANKKVITNKNSVIETPPIILSTKWHKALFVIISFLFSFFIHFPYYGLLNWLPNLLTENFMLDNSVAILISVLAPLATVVGPIIAIRHCEMHTSFLKVSLLYLIAITFLFFITVFVYNLNLFVSLAVIIVLLVLLQGAITIVFSVLSIKMGRFINSGAHASLMNAAGGFAAGFAPAIVGSIIDGAGWQISYIVCFAVCLITTISLVAIILMISKPRNA